MSVRVLCAGDIHIGRQTSKTQIPYRTADAWLAIVNLAVREKPDLVAISGDIVDKIGKSYESQGPVATGLKRLESEGIEIVAVAGNHDHDVLVSLARQPGNEHLKLLGVGGQWEHRTIQRGKQPILHVLAWSFPREYVDLSPMHDVPRIDRGDLPVLGIVHAEIGSETSRYAPVSLGQLRGHDVDFWLLGHIHKPFHYESDRVLYPGSPYAMDPGEPGIHGAWMLTLDGGSTPDVQPIPLSPVEYRLVMIDLTDVRDEAEFQGATMTAIDSDGALTRAGHGEFLQEISIRLHFTGATSVHRTASNMAIRFQQETTTLFTGSIPVSIDKVTVSVQPPVDLHLLATGNDPAAELAQLLLALEEDELKEPYQTLLKNAETELSQVTGSSNFARLDQTEVTASDVRTQIRDRSWSLLSALIGTREPA